jgi:hypothetical protein
VLWLCVRQVRVFRQVPVSRYLQARNYGGGWDGCKLTHPVGAGQSVPAELRRVRDLASKVMLRVRWGIGARPSVSPHSICAKTAPLGVSRVHDQRG